MNRSLQIKLGLVVILLAWSVWSLWPTIQTSRMTADQRADLENTESGQAELDRLQAKAIKQGLDLEGGMYLVLEIDESGLEEDRATDDAIDRVVEILRNRVDQFGVSEPDIRKQGDHRIIVQLPGIQDRDRAVELIGRTARLEFRMVREGNEVTTLLSRLDRVLSGAQSADDPAGKDAASDTTSTDATSTDDAGEEPVAGIDTDDLDVAGVCEAVDAALGACEGEGR